MAYVRLTRKWTDAAGAIHEPGDIVDVDAVTLAQLEADGVVASADTVGRNAKWVGPMPRNTGEDQENSMVYVRLTREWTDADDVTHEAGDIVYVDAVTLAQLEADGVVAASGKVAKSAFPDRAKPDCVGSTPPGPDFDESEW